MIQIRCKLHKRYTGKRAPRAGDCAACWVLFRMRRGQWYETANGIDWLRVSSQLRLLEVL
jgi:hypothetical protein